MRMISDGGGGSKKPPAKTKAQIEADERKAQADREALLATEKRRDAVMASRAPAPAPAPAPVASNSNTAAKAAADKAAADAAKAAADKAAADAAAAEAAAKAAAEKAAADAKAAAEAERKRLQLEAEKRAAQLREEARLYALARQPVPLPSRTREPVKYATPEDVLIDDNELPIDLILKLTLEKIGGLELISLVRHDTVNGQDIIYRPVKNISQLAIEYNPQNMVKMPDSSDSYFKNFPIKLEAHMPQTTNDLPPLVAYIDPVTESVIIDLVNIKPDYEIEVQMVAVGKVFDATIYEEEI